MIIVIKYSNDRLKAEVAYIGAWLKKWHISEPDDAIIYLQINDDVEPNEILDVISEYIDGLNGPDMTHYRLDAVYDYIRELLNDENIKIAYAIPETLVHIGYAKNWNNVYSKVESDLYFLVCLGSKINVYVGPDTKQNLENLKKQIIEINFCNNEFQLFKWMTQIEFEIYHHHLESYERYWYISTFKEVYKLK